MFQKSYLSVLLVAALMLTASVAQAGTFTTTTITGDSNVGISSGLGTYLLAIDMYGSDADTINGVAFTNAGGLSGSGNGLSWVMDYGDESGVVTVNGVSANVNAVLSGYRRSNGMNYQFWGPSKLTISGLTVDTDYTISLFTVAGAGSADPTSVDDNTENVVTLDLGDAGTAYRVDYSFTATDSSQILNFDSWGPDRESLFALTAFTVREAGGGSTIPEPSTLALLATGLFGLLAYAWRKRK